MNDMEFAAMKLYCRKAAVLGFRGNDEDVDTFAEFDPKHRPLRPRRQNL